MSGTSADSIDAVLVDLAATAPKLLATHSADIRGLKSEIHTLASYSENEIHRMGQLDRELGIRFAQATNELLRRESLCATDITAIGSHGQTIRHFPPAKTSEHPYSIQVGDPNTIAQLTGITTVADFRRRDIALGGHGAPLVPAFHQAVFGKAGMCRAIVNIGGVANITLLNGDPSCSPLLGYDTGPGNVLMDSWINQNLGLPYDQDGHWASQGQVISPLLKQLLDTPYLSQLTPKSTGPELFNLSWLTQHLEQLPEASSTDIQATLLEFTARTISDALKSHIPTASEIYFCGGGTYNTSLMLRLETLLDPSLTSSTERLGIPPEWVEAVAFAWLAKQTIEGKPGNEPAVTGASKASILGAIYPA